ncbi:zinc ribbon domain-containing protein [Nocardioides iriomotensis]|uniref:Zinc-ribbon domain-containing protein n=1 Tax=Nocardioides iriomotensis TaxID=715784 RepID=A0A4Q5J2W9_9ACTN|nr:zinc ribbon domain-containing protein [Nocardioides iriomotensis]RYU12703.1 hypothetical protein ETU37_06900 [Nocardioides iriomotensis]
MSNLPLGPSGHPGEVRQRPVGQTVLRYGGGAMAVVGAVLLGTGAYDFLTVDGFGMPTKFWMLMVGIPVLGIGLMLVNLSVARAQVARLREGMAAGGRGCRTCGRQNDAAARFCDACGAQLA